MLSLCPSTTDTLFIHIPLAFRLFESIIVNYFAVARKKQTETWKARNIENSNVGGVPFSLLSVFPSFPIVSPYTFNLIHYAGFTIPSSLNPNQLFMYLLSSRGKVNLIFYLFCCLKPRAVFDRETIGREEMQDSFLSPHT